jgi:hypothetical protein
VEKNKGKSACGEMHFSRRDQRAHSETVVTHRLKVSGSMSGDGQVYLKIGDVARLVGISPSAIRAWEALGLTRPHRTESRYRLYTNDDVRLLKKARYLR